MVASARIHLVAANANEKGRAFELLMRAVLQSLGWNVDNTNIQHAGTELDIEGTAHLGGIKYIAECKAHDENIQAPMIRDFTGKYFPRMMRNVELRGFFFTLSELGKGAKGYLQDEVYVIPGMDQKFTVYAQDDILQLMMKGNLIGDLATIRQTLSERFGLQCFDSKLLCTMDRRYWAHLMGPQEGAPNSFIIAEAFGTIVTDQSLVDRLIASVPEFVDYTWINDQNSIRDIIPQTQPVVHRVKKSSGWFDYRYPADPKYYVGRERELREILRFLTKVRSKFTTSRTFIITGNSGMGKSSMGLKLEGVSGPNKLVVIPIDTRSFDGLSFIPACIKELAGEVSKRTGERLVNLTVAGLDSLPRAMGELDEALRKHDLIGVLLFDQFENILYQKGIARAIRNLAHAVTELSGMVVFGFAWKSDMVTVADEFAYRDKEDLERESHVVTLRSFGPKETAQILSRLESSINDTLNKELSARLKEFSLGYPWLLKKICAHVEKQIDSGYSQERLVNTNLNLKDLFEEDLAGLSEHERHVLKEIARRLPATQQSLMAAEVAEGRVLQSYLHMFLDRRLLTRVRDDKFDVYSEIFREYLITGQIPFIESYILRMWPTPVLEMFSYIRTNGPIPYRDLHKAVETFRKRPLSTKYMGNVLRDLRMLDLVMISDGLLRISDNPEVEQIESELDLVTYLADKLLKNVGVQRISERIKQEKRSGIRSIASMLKELFPTVEAIFPSWVAYAQVLAAWLETAGLAYRGDGSLFESESEALEVRKRAETGLKLPQTYPSRIEEFLAAVERCGSASKSKLVTESGAGGRKLEKCLRDARELRLVERLVNRTYRLTEEGVSYLSSDQVERRVQFGIQAMEIPIVARFVEIIQHAAPHRCYYQDVVRQIMEEQGADWSKKNLWDVSKKVAGWAEYGLLIDRHQGYCTTTTESTRKRISVRPVQAKFF